MKMTHQVIAILVVLANSSTALAELAIFDKLMGRTGQTPALEAAPQPQNYREFKKQYQQTPEFKMFVESLQGKDVNGLVSVQDQIRKECESVLWKLRKLDSRSTSSNMDQLQCDFSSKVKWEYVRHQLTQLGQPGSVTGAIAKTVVDSPSAPIQAAAAQGKATGSAANALRSN